MVDKRHSLKIHKKSFCKNLKKKIKNLRNCQLGAIMIPSLMGNTLS